MDSRSVKIDGCKYPVILGLMNTGLPWKPRGSLCLPTYLGSHCLIKLTDMKSLHKNGGGGVSSAWPTLYALVDTPLAMMLS